MAPVIPSPGHPQLTGKGPLRKCGSLTAAITDQVQVTEGHPVQGRVHHPEVMVLHEEDLQDTDHQEVMDHQGITPHQDIIPHQDISHIPDTSLLQVTVHHDTTRPQVMVHQDTGPLGLVMVVVGTGIEEVPEIDPQGLGEGVEVELSGGTPADLHKDQGPDLLQELLTHHTETLLQDMSMSLHTWEIQVPHHHSTMKGHQKTFPESPETKDLLLESCPLVPST